MIWSAESGNARLDLMKSASEVLQRKELELKRVKEEIDALRVVAQLLRDKGDPTPAAPKKLAKILKMR